MRNDEHISRTRISNPTPQASTFPFLIPFVRFIRGATGAGQNMTAATIGKYLTRTNELALNLLLAATIKGTRKPTEDLSLPHPSKPFPNRHRNRNILVYELRETLSRQTFVSRPSGRAWWCEKHAKGTCETFLRIVDWGGGDV